ncbi:MAG: 3-dehydroquinate synthase [Defluviitaleaceae bacterium]|nr:3-dehydroquinate synthase [Defluviitaleaceae bacterium]
MSEIIIKSGVLKNLGHLVEGLLKVKTFAVISDENVAPLYGKTVADSLVGAGYRVISFTIPAGEKSKCADRFFELQNWLAENHVTRSDALVALGGGVVGDLTGFVAATYLRGVAFVQVPTTLLAMVDSSVGGKTGIDIPAGKNLVGAFHQPKMVVCDPYTLKTLPAEVFSDGCAEVIKHGMIRSKGLLSTLEKSGFDGEIADIIAENIDIKRTIVQRDEFDTGERQLLNFGHTIGHAIEKLSDFEVSHGQAVAIGMCIITRAAVKKGLCPVECLEILERLVEKCGLPAKTDFSAEEIYEAALGDKKRMGDTITEIIPREVGFCELQKMPVSELLEWITSGQSNT